MNKTALHKIALVVLLIAAVGALYGQFLRNPIIFDDMPFFMVEGDGAQPIDRLVFSFIEPRSLPYSTLSWTKDWFGLDLIYFRIGNLFLHLATTVASYFLLDTVFSAIYKPRNSAALSASQAALLGTALFSLHPVATYAVGYLVQRTILMATLFGLITMLIYVHAYLKNKHALQWLCIPFYYLAVFSKEHAIMLFAVLLALSVLLREDWRTRLKSQWGPLTLMFCISIFVVVAKKEILGATYEMEAQRMLGKDSGPLAYPFSIITQCGLFFKYVLLWIVPNINWMSIDMHEPFVRGIVTPHLLGVLLFGIWGAVGVYLLFKRGNRGLIGLALLFPWMLFFTEFASVRIQESFVLYRSYLWAVGGLFALPVAVGWIDKKLLTLLSTAVLATLFMLSMERLATLSQPILVWSDALKLIEEKSGLEGTDRIYYNLGVNYFKADMYEKAEEHFKTAIAIKPDSASSHAALGGLYNARHWWRAAAAEYTQALGIDLHQGLPANWRHFVGRAKALTGAGETREAAIDQANACRLNSNVCEATSLPGVWR